MLIAAALSIAWSVEIVDLQPIAAGQSFTATVEGAIPGERVFLVLGRSAELDGFCPSPIAICADIGRARIIAKGDADTNGHISFDVPVPASVNPGRFYLQAATVSAKSAVFGNLAESPVEVEPIIVVNEPYVPPLTFTGIQATCTATGEAELLSEYIGAAEELVATGYLNGAPQVTIPLTTQSAPAGAVFFFADGSSPVADCASLTWAYQALSVEEEDCVVDGPEESDLVDGGMVDESCRRW